MILFKRNSDPKKMDAIAEAVGGFMKLSLEAVSKERLTESEQAIVDCFLFGAVDFMAHSNEMRDTETISKVTGLVLVKYLSADMDTAWERVLSMASMSNNKAGKEVMRQGGRAIHDFIKFQDLKSTLLLRDLIENEHSSIG